MACDQGSYVDLSTKNSYSILDVGDPFDVGDAKEVFPPFSTPHQTVLPTSFYHTPPYPSTAERVRKPSPPSTTPTPAMIPLVIMIRTTLPLYKGKPSQTNHRLALTILLLKAANTKKQLTSTEVKIDACNPFPQEMYINITKSSSTKPKDNTPSTSLPTTTIQEYQHTITITFWNTQSSQTTTQLLDQLTVPWSIATPRCIMGKLYGFRGSTKDEQIIRDMQPYFSAAPSLRIIRHIYSKDIAQPLDDSYFTLDEDDIDALLAVDPDTPTSTTLKHPPSFSYWIGPKKTERNCSHCKKKAHPTGTCPQATTSNTTPGYRGACHYCGSYQHAPQTCTNKKHPCTACGKQDHSFYGCPFTIGVYEKLKSRRPTGNNLTAAANDTTHSIHPHAHQATDTHTKQPTSNVVKPRLRLHWNLKSYASAAGSKHNLIPKATPKLIPSRHQNDTQQHSPVPDHPLLFRLQAQLDTLTQKLNQKEDELKHHQQRILALETLVNQNHHPSLDDPQHPTHTTRAIATTPPMLPPTPRMNRNVGNSTQAQAPMPSFTIAHYFQQTDITAVPPKPGSTASKTITTSMPYIKTAGKRKQPSESDTQTQRKTSLSHPNTHEMQDDGNENEEHKYVNDTSTPGNHEDIINSNKRIMHSERKVQARCDGNRDDG